MIKGIELLQSRNSRTERGELAKILDLGQTKDLMLERSQKLRIANPWGMKTSKELEIDRSIMYETELLECPICNSSLSKCNYRSGRKVVQSLHEVLAVSYQPYRCLNPECANYGNSIRSARWLQLAPLHCTYAFDVIAQIGRLRQSARTPFLEIHAQLSTQVQLSEEEEVTYIMIGTSRC